MDLNFIWKAAVIVIFGVLALRLAGRKSISQLTVPQTIIMISIGTLLIQPVSQRGVWITLAVAILFVLMLIAIEILVVKFDWLENLFYGKAVMVVENGQIIERNLKKLRLTVDMLEVRLRQQGVANFTDLQRATIEPNGKLGYLLKPLKQNATKEDIQKLITLIESKLPIPYTQTIVKDFTILEDIFSEVHHKKHIQKPPEYLN